MINLVKVKLSACLTVPLNSNETQGSTVLILILSLLLNIKDLLW